jgi:hypothetical protein
LKARQAELFGKVAGRAVEAEISNLLEDTVWGRVEWPSRIGRPTSPTLWQGFKFEHWGKQEELDQQNGQIIEVPAPKPALNLWDDLSDSGVFRVNFWAMSHQIGKIPNWITVNFADGISWSRPAPGTFRERGIRTLTPQVQSFDMSGGGPVFLQPFKVHVRPFFFPTR